MNEPSALGGEVPGFGVCWAMAERFCRRIRDFLFLQSENRRKFSREALQKAANAAADH